MHTTPRMTQLPARTGARGGTRTHNLPITNRLRCRCATRAVSAAISPTAPAPDGAKTKKTALPADSGKSIGTPLSRVKHVCGQEAVSSRRSRPSHRRTLVRRWEGRRAITADDGLQERDWGERLARFRYGFGGILARSGRAFSGNEAIGTGISLDHDEMTKRTYILYYHGMVFRERTWAERGNKGSSETGCAGGASVAHFRIPLSVNASY